MPRKVRDFLLSAVSVAVLAGLLLAVNPDLRARVTRLTADQQVDFVRGTTTHAVMSSFGMVQSYAGDNNYLFGFMVAAVLFFVLMLKVIR